MRTSLVQCPEYKSLQSLELIKCDSRIIIAGRVSQWWMVVTIRVTSSDHNRKRKPTLHPRHHIVGEILNGLQVIYSN